MISGDIPWGRHLLHLRLVDYGWKVNSKPTKFTEVVIKGSEHHLGHNPLTYLNQKQRDTAGLQHDDPALVPLISRGTRSGLITELGVYTKRVSLQHVQMPRGWLCKVLMDGELVFVVTGEQGLVFLENKSVSFEK